MERASNLNPDRDILLLRSFLQGQPQVCELVETWVRLTVRSARLAIPPDEQDDLAQESLASILVAAGREGFQINRSFRGFVRKITLARCIDWIRRRRAVVPLVDELAASDEDPLERLSNRERSLRIRQALMDLNPPCRKLIRQRFYERQAYRAIAESWEGATVGALRVRLHDCLQKLRRIVDGNV